VRATGRTRSARCSSRTCSALRPTHVATVKSGIRHQRGCAADTIARHEDRRLRQARPGGHSRLDPASKRLDRSGEGALNHFDANAVEEALRLKGDSDAEVVVVSLGPAKAADSLRKALAMGADRAVLVSDDAAAGSDLVATSMVLAKALERESADLVIFGQQASDGDGAVLWAAVAERLHRTGRLAGRGADTAGRLASPEAPNRVRYDVIEAATARGSRRERRDQ